MKIAFLASEAVPYAKTGGLADVVGSLPRYLGRQGIEVALFLPFYLEVQKKNLNLSLATEFYFSWQEKDITVSLWKHETPEIRVYFIQNDHYFLREGIYGTAHGDHPDNAERFAFYCLACLEAMKALGFQPDLIHAHDWQAAVTFAYLRYRYGNDPFFGRSRSLFTIHNLSYQGLFPPEIIEKIGLPRLVYRMEEMEYYGRVSFLKAGLVYADALSTVSPTYSREIQQPEHGGGLDGVLRIRASSLYGILNGIDTSVWNPEKDPLIPFRYSLHDLAGKKKCKQELIKYFGFPALAGKKPLFGMVSRLADQKGLDLVVASLEELFSLGLNLVILGQGDQKYHDLLSAEQQRRKGRLGVKLAFDEALAHLIIAGCDFFLIPSRFEPCGLTQMYSLLYGTIPVVRSTGGLADTVEEFDSVSRRGNGFKFNEYSGAALVAAVQKALQVYAQAELRQRLIQNAMAADFSWEKSARQYLGLYEKIIGS
ncbi:MAG: glycogen synthase GlgA [Candidatus Aminicenantales bacterium]